MYVFSARECASVWVSGLQQFWKVNIAVVCLAVNLLALHFHLGPKTTVIGTCVDVGGVK